MRWNEDRPGDGDLSGVERIAGYLAVAAERVEGLAFGADSVNVNVTDRVWSGQARRVWGDRLVEETRRLWPLPEAFREGQRVLQVYAAAVAEIEVEAARRRELIEGIADAARVCEALAVRRGDPWRCEQVWWPSAYEGRVVASPDLPCEDSGRAPMWGIRDVGEAQTWAVYVNEEMRWQEAAVRVLAERRTAVDQEAAHGLRATMPVTWAAERAAFISAGITDPREMIVPLAATEASSVEAIASMAAGMAAVIVARGLVAPDLSRTDRIRLCEALTSATAGREQDVVFWTTFFEGFPPEDLPEAMLEVFPSTTEVRLGAGAVEQAGHDAFASVRAGLALYTTSLPYAEQSRLGRELASAAMDEGRFGGRTLSFLMADPRLPGGVYAGAMTELDSLERVQDRDWADDTYWTDEDSPEFGESVSWDPAVPILAGLSRHPAAALDFFSPHATGGDVPVASEVSTARIEYWVRDRAYHDDLTALSGAIAAATAAPINTQVVDPISGRPRDLTARDVRAAWTLSVVSGVIDERKDLTELSEEAALSLTAAFSPHVAQGLAVANPAPEPDEFGRMQWADESFTPGAEQTNPAAEYMRLRADYNPGVLREMGTEAVPSVSAAGLEAVIAASTRYDSALGSWMVATVAERERLFDLAFSNDLIRADGSAQLLRPDDRRALIDQGFQVQSGVLGMATEAMMARGMEHDDAVDTVSGALTSATGWVPGGSYARPLIDHVAGEVVTELAGTTLGAGPGAYTAAVESERALLSAWDDAWGSLEARAAALPELTPHDRAVAIGNGTSGIEAKMANHTGVGKTYFWGEYRSMHENVSTTDPSVFE